MRSYGEAQGFNPKHEAGEGSSKEVLDSEGLRVKDEGNSISDEDEPEPGQSQDKSEAFLDAYATDADSPATSPSTPQTNSPSGAPKVSVNMAISAIMTTYGKAIQKGGGVFDPAGNDPVDSETPHWRRNSATVCPAPRQDATKMFLGVQCRAKVVPSRAPKGGEVA